MSQSVFSTFADWLRRIRTSRSIARRDARIWRLVRCRDFARRLAVEPLEDRRLLAALGSLGTDFWVAFSRNYSFTGDLILTIASEQDATGNVAVPGIAFSQDFSVTAGNVATVNLPTASVSLQNSDVVTGLGVHVTASADVAVYGLNQQERTTDAYLGLPVDSLGTDYLVMAAKSDLVNPGSQLAVVGVQDSTSVTITPSATVGSRVAGAPYTISLDQGQTYFLETAIMGEDLTGSVVQSTKPVAVFGGHRCANVPGNVAACDHVVEQLPPVPTWGQNFVTTPFATRTSGDVFRILASEDSTVVQIDGSVVANLNRGQFHEVDIASAQFSHITASRPVLVAQLMKGQYSDDVNADPLLMLVLPTEQFLPSYVISTAGGAFTGATSNYVNVTAPTSVVGSVLLDGTPIPASDFTAIGTSGFSGAQINISPGIHPIRAPDPIGVNVYGFAYRDSYGYPAGGSFEALAGAINDFYSTYKNFSLTATAGGVPDGLLANDEVGDNPPISVIAYDAVSTKGGTVVVQPNGGFTYTPKQDFLGQDTFTYTIEDAADVQDTATVVITVNADLTLPTVDSFTPADDAVDVGLDTNLVIDFSEDVQKGTGNFVIRKSSDDSVVETFDIATSSRVTVSNDVVTIDPTLDFAGETGYYVEITSGVFEDLRGNDYAGISDKTTWNFITEDVAPPTVDSFSPADDAVDVVLDTNLVIDFSEDVQEGTGDLVIRKSSDDSVVETFDIATSGRVTISKDVATIDPTLDFAGETDYYVEIASGAFEDLSGNDYAGISDKTTWNFTTEDVAPPTVDSFTPADDAVKVLWGTNLVIDFSENVRKGTGNLVIKKSSDDSVVETFDIATSGRVTISNDVATIDPTTDFAVLTGYYVEIASGGFEDLSGNDYAGIGDKTTWNFTIMSDLDWGDTPAPYPTTPAEDGPRHRIRTTGPTLGVDRDGEESGIHSADADGDDNDTPDDEDGVTFGAIRVGQLGASVTVNVQNAPDGARLDAWIDLDRDGSWGGVGEQIADNLAVSAGDTTIIFDVPNSTKSGTTYARFRVSTAGNLTTTGYAADGEVEDYRAHA